ncbi:YrhK family protein [Bacillus infantis]|uniref:YrhK family protein n=1 Tax=Bacillus infantis TaxID=324767 RepID=UPI003CEF2F38
MIALEIEKKVYDNDEDVYIQVGKYKMIVEKRYNVLSWLNDFFLGVLYFIGSILYLIDVDQRIAISFFLAGSILMIARAVLNILKDLHIRSIKPGSGKGRWKEQENE